MPTDTQLERDLDSRVFRLGETLRTARLSDMGSGIRLAEHHVPGLAAHAVSEIGHPPPSAAPRIPRIPLVSTRALLVLLAAPAVVAILGALAAVFWTVR